MEKPYKVLVTHPEVPESALELLTDACELIMCESNPPKREEILCKSKGVDGIFWAGHEKIDAEALDAAGPQLKSISTMSAGIDFVDVPELKRRKIPLGHTPLILNDAVADLAIGLMIAAARRFHEGRIKIEKLQWENWHLNWMLGQDIVGSRVGFVGFGGIGQTIAKRLKGFDIGKIFYTCRKPKPEDAAKYEAEYVTFEELLKECSFVFITCPLTDETKGMFNEVAFNLMQPTSVLINVARGPIVDQAALYKALKEKKIFAAGLDVMTPEPLDKDDPLLQLPNCVVIPHLGSATEDTRKNMAEIASHNILRGLAGEPMLAPAY